MPRARLTDHLILIAGVVFMAGPVVILLWRLVVGLDPAGVWQVFRTLWVDGLGRGTLSAAAMTWNSMVLALGVALIKCTFSLLAAYALLFFRLPAARLIYGTILLTLFFPIETRILPTFLVADSLGLLDTFTGMILPITASGLGVLVFGQFMRQLPPALFEAARIDGAGPVRVLIDIVVPLSVSMIVALFVILFVLGWNQYVWPIMIATTSQDHDTLVRGIAYAGFGGRAGLALALLAMLPPVLLVVLLRRPLMRGLTTGLH